MYVLIPPCHLVVTPQLIGPRIFFALDSGRELVRTPRQRGRLRHWGQDRRGPATGARREDLHLQPRGRRVETLPGPPHAEVRVRVRRVREPGGAVRRSLGDRRLVRQPVLGPGRGSLRQ